MVFTLMLIPMGIYMLGAYTGIPINHISQTKWWPSDKVKENCETILNLQSFAVAIKL